ncbi:MAG: toxin-antitoxin system YwqK family antitoxin [Cytophagaceae bacterium]
MMSAIRILLPFLIFLSFSVSAQKGFELPGSQRVVLNYIDHVVYANILHEESKIKVDDDKYYYWYNANDIKTTRGGYDGKLLHGNYTEYYPNKNLKQKGEFKYGLKVGEWRNWNISGEFEEIYNWKKGVLHGKFKIYDSKGTLVKTGSYKQGNLDGKQRVYMKDNTVQYITYNNGEPVIKVKKMRKFPFLLKKRNELPPADIDPVKEKPKKEKFNRDAF